MDGNELSFDTSFVYESEAESIVDVIEIESSGDLEGNGDAESAENADIDRPADSTMNSDVVSAVEPIEVGTVPKQKRKLSTEGEKMVRKLSTEDESMERILKQRVTVVIKRMKFDENLNEWILPADTVKVNAEKANHNEEGKLERENESETTAEVLNNLASIRMNQFYFMFFQFYISCRLLKRCSRLFVDARK